MLPFNLGWFNDGIEIDIFVAFINVLLELTRQEFDLKLILRMGYMNYDGQTEKVDLETISTFDRVTEWKKDAWTSTRGFPSNLADYLECSKILNAE